MSRTCQSCPAWEPLDISEELLATTLAIPQWGKVMGVKKGKEVYALNTNVFSVQEALKLLKKQMEAMPTHLYKIAVMYEAVESSVCSV